ncbi:MAG: peptidase C11, partial [Lachnospiraceae bacterium]|nr:peptidase C11 [Lachnospiraceae bacterium]
MADNRPTGRQRKVLDGGMDVHKRGEGLGSGPVGSGGRPGGSSGDGGGNPLRSGGSKLAIIAIVLLLLFGGGSNLFSSETHDETYPEAQTQQTQQVQSGQGPSHSLAENNETEPFAPAGQGTEAADTSVAEGARDKFTTIKGDGSDTVTIMVYMCGTDLESKHGMATNDLNEMAKATLSDKVNIIVYTGGCKQWNNRVISSRTNQIYRVKDGGLECLESDMGSEVMVKPETLTNFIKYCTKNYPADRNEIIFWDHGGGSLSGFGYDEKNALSGSMTLDGINRAFKDAGIKFDFIGFDACLMATVENALMLEQYGDYLIASEETEPGVGWYYTNWLTALSKNTSMPTVEIGKRIVDDFVDV